MATGNASDANKLKFHVFMKCVLDFQLREHEKFLGHFIAMFKRVDQDKDGVINEVQFRDLMFSLGFNIDPTELES